MFYEQPPAMSLSPQLKMARWPKADVNKAGKYSLLNDIKRWGSCSGGPRDCVNRVRLWPLRRDDHSCVMVVASRTRRSDWHARVLAYDVSMRIDR